MTRLKDFVALLGLITALAARGGSAHAQSGQAETGPPAALQNARGLRLVAVTDVARPALRIVLPGHALSDRSIEVLVPEHVTAVGQGSTAAEHLFLPGAGRPIEPAWRAVGRSLEYRRELSGAVDMVARATLEDDGVRFQYELTNRSAVRYDMITAVTDPRLTGIFHDLRLERTYVHHSDGFDLLASDVPMRLTLPLERWLPSRVLASFTWPVPAQRIEQRADGITYYNKSRAVDLPLIVTRSTDGAWAVASFSQAPGNVWSNPELTCQHVDPQASLSPQQRIVLEVKLLVVRGSLDDALREVIRQRGLIRRENATTHDGLRLNDPVGLLRRVGLPSTIAGIPTPQ